MCVRVVSSCLSSRFWFYSVFSLPDVYLFVVVVSETFPPSPFLLTSTTSEWTPIDIPFPGVYLLDLVVSETFATPSPLVSPCVAVSCIFFELPRTSWATALLPITVFPLFSRPRLIEDFAMPSTSATVFFAGSTTPIPNSVPMVWMPVLCLPSIVFASMLF